MRIGRAQKVQMPKIGRHHIVGELSGALEQQIVLHAANVLAAAEGTKAAVAGVG